MTPHQPKRLHEGFALGRALSSRGINWLTLAEELRGLIPIRTVSQRSPWSTDGAEAGPSEVLGWLDWFGVGRSMLPGAKRLELASKV